jgi:hypothetical protein
VWREGTSQNYKGVWHFNETGTVSSWNDSTALAHHATNSGVTPTTGKIGGAANFADHHYFETAESEDFGFTGDFTIGGWFYLPDTPYSVNVWKGGYANAYSAYFNYDTAGIFGQCLVGNDLVISYSPPIAEWFHWQITRSGTTVSAYANGQYVGGGYRDFASTSPSTALFGVDGDHYSVPYTGRMDEIRIAKGVARSTSWIAAEYANQSAPGTFIQPSGTPISTAASVSVSSQTIYNTAPFSQNEAIGTATASGGSGSYTWQIVSQTNIS